MELVRLGPEVVTVHIGDNSKFVLGISPVEARTWLRTTDG
jgi:hypothetical protein